MTGYKEKILSAVQTGDYVLSRKLIEEAIQDGEQYDDELAVLDATSYQAEGNMAEMFLSIKRGLQFDYKNYELYFLLGMYYWGINLNQAYLCFQNALLYCENEEDQHSIQDAMQQLLSTGEVKVSKLAIIIVSYNAKYLQQKNIESIRKTLARNSYEIIVVDNASEDGVTEWLDAQEDILLIKNTENKGFSVACNQGVLAAREQFGQDMDIYLLNNDTRLTPNAVFWLRMGLYESDEIGATGSISNYAGNNQQVEIEFEQVEDYVQYGIDHNIPLEQPYEERVRLSGFSMLVRGDVWKQAGGMDEDFAPGYFEDDALSMEILKTGHRLLLCKNSYIYHAGSQSFAKREDVNDLLLAHHQLFIQKYGFDILQYAYCREDFISQIPFTMSDRFCALIIESGIGAELKMLRTLFHNARIVGLEKDEVLARLSAFTDEVYSDFEILSSKIYPEKFDLLLADAQALSRLSNDEKIKLAALCKPECIILPQVNPYKHMDFDKIKLIIWDLDDTLWQGTLSEGEVLLSLEHKDLIRDLVDCGIVNSISSKNNQEEVEKLLKQNEINDYFVFNNINWDNKGQQIFEKLNSMGLRAENTLFIDDNVRNLEEAKYINPTIMTALPDVITHLTEYIKKKKKTDIEHTRLKQYQLLEKKLLQKKEYASDDMFLMDSQIRVKIAKDCYDQVDRISELVARTNQLNYTKLRSTKDEILKMISNDWYDTGYIKVKDRFGDYGIVGFYCINKQEKRLEHFLFSCRILGMKIEDYVYSKIGKPKFEIAPPVARNLTGEDTPWIQEWVDDALKSVQNKQDRRIRILLKGPCDMSAIESYLIGGRITTEFNYVNDKGVITTGQNHSMHILEGQMLKKEQIHQIIQDAPFLDMGDFETFLFEKQYHIVCYSLLPDCHAGLYRHKESGHVISFGSVNFDLTDEDNWQGYINGEFPNHAFQFTEKILEEFKEKWEFIGTTDPDLLIRNLQYIYNHMPGNPALVLLLGSEIEYEGDDLEFANHAKRHALVNRRVEEFAKDKKRITLINMTDFIQSQNDYEGCINHFGRRVYYDLATSVVEAINNSF